MKDLEEVIVVESKLRDIPSEISELQVLNILEASYGKLGSLPGAIGELKKLRSI